MNSSKTNLNWETNDKPGAMDNKTINGAIQNMDYADKVRGTISQRSEIVQEVLNRKPKFVEKWSLLLFLIILLALLAATWFIHYPDIIETRASITAANAPKEIIPYQEGRVVKLFIKSKDFVKKDDMLAWIESTANHTEVLALSTQLDSSIHLLNTGQMVSLPGIFNVHLNNLGDLQKEYREFTASLQLYNDYVVNGFYANRKKHLENDLHSLEGTRRTIAYQKELDEQRLKLIEETYNINKKLFDEKIISAEELKAHKANLLSRQMAVSQIEASLFSNEAQKREKQVAINQIDHDIDRQKTEFEQALLSLKSSVDQWKKKHILQSPIDGEISFIIPLQENQFIAQGKLLGYVNPADSRFYAEAYLQQKNFGKIQAGAKVQLRVDAYPYQEVGYISGSIGYISNVASDSGFMAAIQFEKGLVTSNNFVIPYKNGLQAQAIIITKDMRLLQRLYYGLIKSTSVGQK